jgi:hypothetical protein
MLPTIEQKLLNLKEPHPYEYRSYHVESFFGKNQKTIGICVCRVSRSKL